MIGECSSDSFCDGENISNNWLAETTDVTFTVSVSVTHLIVVKLTKTMDEFQKMEQGAFFIVARRNNIFDVSVP
jgi:hypothetical protein